MNPDDYCKAGDELYHRLHLLTYPVAIKYIKDESEIPAQAVRPSAGGQKWSLCQAFTYARRWGMHSAMTEKDNFCVPASAMHQWVDVSPDDFIESQVRQGWHADRKAEENRYAAYLLMFGGPGGRERMEKARQYIGFICSPLHQTIVEPDTVMVYGDGAHVMHLVQALCFDYTFPVMSSFEGFGETCAKGGLVPFITGRPQVVIPGMGDRAFAGIQDHEIGVSFPGGMIQMVLDNLFKTGGGQNIGCPLKTLMPIGLTESITPGFEFLRKKVDGE